MSFSRNSTCFQQEVFSGGLILYSDFQSEAHLCANPPALAGGSLVHPLGEKYLEIRLFCMVCDVYPAESIGWI